MTKGNDGRAARKLLIQRLSVVLVAFLVCIACLHSMGIGKVASLRRDLATSLNMQNANALRTKLKEGAQLSKSMFKKFAADQQKQQKQRRKQQQQQQQQQQKQTQQTKDPQIIRVTFDDDTESEAQQLLLNAQVHLVAIDSSDPKSAVFGDFCTLNFAVHKSDPSSVPMFRHLVEQSPDCAKIRYRVNLRDYVQHATQYDQREGTTTKSLNLTAVVFHESRCGSTLVSNALVAMNPAKHRVYSESGPPIDALKSMCGETYQSCSLKVASKILQDVMFAMGRTQDPAEERVFFKIQSMGTRNLKVFQHAYPKVPFLFVYRDPVQVMMSQLSNGNKNANCVRPRHRPPSSVSELCSRKGLSVRELSDEEYCAAHLASITEAALEGMQQSESLGMPINYVDLPSILWETVLPRIGVDVSEDEVANMKAISTQYSKGGDGRKSEFHRDSEQKEKHASDAIREASTLFLKESFDALQVLQLT